METKRADPTTVGFWWAIVAAVVVSGQRLGSPEWVKIVATPGLEFGQFLNMFLSVEGGLLLIVFIVAWVIVGSIAGARQQTAGKQKESPAPKTSGIEESELITARLTGVSFEGRQTAICAMSPGDVVRLYLEQDNPYDQNAIVVWNTKGEQLGYIKKELAARVAPIVADRQFEEGQRFLGHVVSDPATEEFSTKGLTIEFKIPTREEFARDWETDREAESYMMFPPM